MYKPKANLKSRVFMGFWFDVDSQIYTLNQAAELLSKLKNKYC